MFIYSFRAGTIKFFAIICVALVALIALIAFVPTYASGKDSNVVEAGNSTTVDYKYDKVKNVSDAAGFLSQFGWTVNAATAEKADVSIPAEFDKIFAGYNEIQKSQGLDLSKYKKKDVVRYTFEVTNYEGHDGKVYANVLVYRNKVIGGDICSASVDGFIHGFENPRD